MRPGVPSAPRSVISNVNETSLVLEWSEPQDAGGRDDLLYNVICKKCSVERRLCTRCDDNVEFVPRQLGLTERRIYISNLMAHTQYTFEVQAVNGISSKSPFPPHFASVNITTNQAGQCRRWSCSASCCRLSAPASNPLGEFSSPLERASLEGMRSERVQAGKGRLGRCCGELRSSQTHPRDVAPAAKGGGRK